MEKLKVELEVTKEAHELAMGVLELIKAVKKSLDDGFQPGQDIPVIAMEAFQKMLPAVEGVSKLGEEAKELKPFLAVWANLGLELSDVFLAKKQ